MHGFGHKILDRSEENQFDMAGNNSVSTSLAIRTPRATSHMVSPDQKKNLYSTEGDIGIKVVAEPIDAKLE